MNYGIAHAQYSEKLWNSDMIVQDKKYIQSREHWYISPSKETQALTPPVSYQKQLQTTQDIQYLGVVLIAKLL